MRYINRVCPVPLLHLEGSVDFGTVPADGRVLKQHVEIINKGSKTGNFEISYSGAKSITFVPNSGSVEPHTRLSVEVKPIVNC